MKTYLLILFHFSLFLFPFSLFPFTCHAADLSLTSSNQYVYCHVLTNATFDVSGLGMGKDGDYSMMRYEDWYFLSEAVSERAHVCRALRNDATTVTENSIGEFGLTIPYYASLPNYALQAEDMQMKYLDLVGTTNRTYLSKPENYIAGTAVYDDASKFADETDYIKMIFQNRRCPISTDFLDKMGRTQYAGGWFIAQPRIPFMGIVTNWYADLIKNSHPIFIQNSRLCNGPYSRRTQTKYSKASVLSGYHFDGGNIVWDSSPLTDTDITTQNSGTYNAGSYILITSERRTATKTTLEAKRDGVVVAQNRDAYSSWFLSERNTKGRLTLPKFEQGTILNGIHRGFVVVDFTRTASSGTNVFVNVHKKVIGPANLVYEGTTDEGYPVFRHENGLLYDLHEACCQILGQEVMGGNELLGRIDYPTSAGSVTATDQIITRVEYFLGHADVTFHARVL